MEALKIKFSF